MYLGPTRTSPLTPSAASTSVPIAVTNIQTQHSVNTIILSQKQPQHQHSHLTLRIASQPCLCQDPHPSCNQYQQVKKHCMCISDKITCSIYTTYMIRYRGRLNVTKNKVYYGASQVYYGKSSTSCEPIRLLDLNELCTKIISKPTDT